MRRTLLTVVAVLSSAAAAAACDSPARSAPQPEPTYTAPPSPAGEESDPQLVLAATTGIGVTQADVDHMVQSGFIAADPSSGAGAAAAPAAAAGEHTSQQRYAEAYPLATKLTASLGLRGFKLNLAVEAASGYDDLLALLPKIQDAVGPKAAAELEKALKG